MAKFERRPSETMTQLPDSMYNVIKSSAEKRGLLVRELTTGPGAAKDANFLGEMVRIRVVGRRAGASDEDEEEVKLHLMAKLCPEGQRTAATSSSINRMFAKEIAAYSKILPMLEQCVPSCDFPEYYAGSASAEGSEYVLMEDLAHSRTGYRALEDAKPTLDGNHARVVVEYLARFHAASFVLQRKHHGFYDVFAALVAGDVQYSRVPPPLMELFAKNMIESVADEGVRNKLAEFFGNRSNAIETFLDPDRTVPYNVFTHGDCWMGNIFFKYQNDKPVGMTLIDWQTVRLASPVTDLAFFVSVCTDAALRREHLPKMLDLYHETLAATLEEAGCEARDCYPERVYREHLRQLMPMGLVSASIVLPLLLAEGGPSGPDESPGDKGEERIMSIPQSEKSRSRMNELAVDFSEFGYIK